MKLLFCLLLLTYVTYATKPPYHKIRLNNILETTFHAEEMTSVSRRHQKFLQLQCVGGSAAKESYKVQTVFCKNNNLYWSCRSNLPSGLTFGYTKVTCEGYDSDDDPYVPIENGELFQEKLGAELVIASGMMHFSADEGITEVPVALEKLIEISK